MAKRTTSQLEACEPAQHQPHCSHPDKSRLVWSPGLTQRGNSPIAKLVKEWQLIGSRRKEVDAVNSWDLPGGEIANLDQVLVRAGFNTARDDSRGDAYLWLLVKRASNDELATRIVLQRILPPLVSIGRRRGQIIDGGVDAAIAELLPTAWTVIRQFPWQRRQHKVASNLVLDSEYFAFVQGNRAKKVKVFSVEPRLLGELVAEPETEDFEQETSLENLISAAIGQGIEPRHVEVLRAVASGQTAATIAEHYGIAERTARAWRALAINELRARTRCAV